MRRKISIAALFGAVLLAAALFLTAPHWWRKVNGATITYNGQPSPGSTLYRSHNGMLLLHLMTAGDEDLFVVYMDRKRSGIPNPSRFVMLPGYAYSKDNPPYFISLDDGVKVEWDPQLVIKDVSFELTTDKAGRVRVTW